MENLFIGKSCSKRWLVFLITNNLCFSWFCFNYVSLIGSKIEILKVNSREEKTITKSKVDLCWGRYIYIHNLPSQFNEDVLRNCQLLTRKTDKYDMCLLINNSGFGPQVENFNHGVLSNTRSWFCTYIFMLEVIFHNRMKNYKCLTNDSSLASAIYVPFYAGLDLRRHLWGYNISVRDASGFELVKWLTEKPEWKKMWGIDHFLVSGRMSRDFRRKSDDNSEWGSKFRFLPEFRNMSMLSVESSLNNINNNEFAIPYPTSFHPSTEIEVSQWQDRMRTQTRPYLFSFVGARRSGNKCYLRDIIINQCLESSNNSCKFMDCSSSGSSNCDNPLNVMQVFQNSVFCLQPPGDSYTRKSTFDSILAGCIPVFFHPGSAYSQYVWHLPENHTKYSVFISEKSLRDRISRFIINEALVGVSKEEQEAMREQVIRLIPRIVYADNTIRLETGFEDAFDLAVKGILDKIETSRRVIKEKEKAMDSIR